jgi:MFS transporter
LRQVARRSPWTILGMAVAMQFGVSLIDQGILTLTGFIKQDLGLSAFTAGLLVASFALGRIGGAYGAGVAADRLGEQRTLLVGGLATAAIVLVAAASPLPLLVPLLVLAGATGASATPAGGRLVLLAFPRNRRGFALGIRQTGIPVAGLIAALALPWIAHFASWRWSIAVAATVTALTAVPLLSLRGEPRPPHPSTPLPHVGRDRDLLLLTVWGCLIVTGQYALITFLALDLNQNAGITLAEGVDPRRGRERRRRDRARGVGALQRPAPERQPQALPAHDQRRGPARIAAPVRRPALGPARAHRRDRRARGSRADRVSGTLGDDGRGGRGAGARGGRHRIRDHVRVMRDRGEPAPVRPRRRPDGQLPRDLARADRRARDRARTRGARARAPGRRRGHLR